MSLLLAGLLCWAAVPSAAQSLRQRVRTEALHTYYHGITAEIARERIGAAGVPVLIELAADPTFPRRDNVVALLGWLGGAESTEALLALLARPPATLDAPSEDRAVLLAPQSLGQIAGRGEPRALAALLAMTAHGAGGGPLRPTVERAATASALDLDLIEMAMRGLAYAREPRATERLRAIESGAVRPLPAARALRGARDLRAAARLALELAGELGGAASRASVDSGPQLDGEEEGAPVVGDRVAGARSVRLAVDSVFDPVHSTVKRSLITYANHPAVQKPMTDALLDQLLADAALVLGRADFEGDVACCAGIARSGPAQTFGSIDDGLDKIDSVAEIGAVLSNPIARVKVVRIINYCGGSGTNIIGCGRLNGEGIAVVREEGSFFSFEEGSLWLHEYGHNVGLGHNTDSRYVMFGCLCGTNWGLTQTECNRFHTPAGGADAAQTDLGVCTDVDADGVQDQIDNCPSAPNNDQDDDNGDGEGDVCEAPVILDVDGNGEPNPLFDGVLLMRWMFGFRGDFLIAGAVGPGCSRCTAVQVENRLAGLGLVLDVDGDGEVEPLTDGVLVVRWLFDLRGDELLGLAVDEDECTRCSASAIETHLAGIS